MADKKPMPADGGGRAKGEPDGVSGTPDGGEMGRVHGRLSGGESGGGAYPDGGAGKDRDRSGFGGHGGQSENAYYGGDNPNATAGSGEPAAGDGQEPTAGQTPDREPHSLRAGRRTVEVVEESGIAAAEATGKIATDARYEKEQEAPGGG